MAKVSITIKDENGAVKSSVCGEERAVLVYEGTYCEGDTITFTTDAVNQHYVVRVDDTMDEALMGSHLMRRRFPIIPSHLPGRNTI